MRQSKRSELTRQIEVVIIDRHARLANHLDVQPASEFAERMLGLEMALKAAPKSSVKADDSLLDSFMDRTVEYRNLFGGAS